MAGFTDIGMRLRGWPRRLAAAACLLLAVGSALAARSGARLSGGAGHDVVVAARDLPVGTVLASGDLRVARWPDELAPAGVVRSAHGAVGHRLASAVQAREAVTATRLAGAGLTAGLPPGYLATSVALTASAAALVHGGDALDLYVATASSDVPAATTPASARLLAEHVRVLAVVATTPAPATADSGMVVIVAVDRPTAVRIASVADRPLVAAVSGGS